MSLALLREWFESPDPQLAYLGFHTAFFHPDTVAGLAEPERLERCLAFLAAGLAGRYRDAIPDGPYVLGHTVAGWLRTLAAADAPADRSAARAVESMLARTAREGDASTRDVIVLGVLEHVLGDPAVAPLFAHWAGDPALAPLYREGAALAEGGA